MHEHLHEHKYPVVELKPEKVLVVPMEHDAMLDEAGIPHKKAVMKNYTSEVQHMSPEIELEVGCNHGHTGIGAGLVGGLVGGAVAGGGLGWGGRGGYYGMPYGGYGYNAGVSVGDMYSAAETNKVGHTVSRDIFATDRDLSQKQMMGDFATLQKIGDSDLKNAIAHLSLAKDISDVKSDLKSDILENRHLSTMEACATREKINESTGLILAKMACDREQELRDQLMIERTKCNRAEDTIIQNQIVTGLENLDGRIEQIVYKIVNGSTK